LALGPEQSIATGLLAVCWMKEGPKTRMLRALSAEAVRIPNGSNHHLLKFALICPPLATEHAARYLTPKVPPIQNDLLNTAQRALVEERKGYKGAQNRSKDTAKTRSLS
jgi:hypothetical protein